MMRTFKCGHGHGPFNTNARSRCRVCARTNYRRWCTANPERRAATNKAWQEANREHSATAGKAYRATNRETRISAAKDWRKANPGYHAAASKAWRVNNRELCNQHIKLRRHRKRAVGALTLDEWLGVLDKYGSLCLACGSGAPPTIDHVTPLSAGGLNTMDNVQPLCGPCNSSKWTKTVDYRPDQQQAS